MALGVVRGARRPRGGRADVVRAVCRTRVVPRALAIEWRKYGLRAVASNSPGYRIMCLELGPVGVLHEMAHRTASRRFSYWLRHACAFAGECFLAAFRNASVAVRRRGIL